MIKIIDGLRYDTSKAELVFRYWNGYSRSDFKYRSKALYRTKKGNWFIHHDGGALSDMAVSMGNGTAGSESLEVISADEAYEFLEGNSDETESLDAIVKYFPGKVVDA